MDISLNQLNTQQTNVSNLEESLNVSTASIEATKTSSVLSGKSVTLVTTTDFEKLLAELQADQDKQEKELSEIKLSASLAAITGAANGLEESQNVALVELQMATETLENLVEAYTITDEERKEKQQEKAQLTEEKNAIEQELAVLEEDAEKNAEQIAGLKATLSELDAKIATLDSEIAQCEQTLSENRSAQAEAQAQVDGAMAKLDQDTLMLLEGLVRLTAADVSRRVPKLEEEKAEQTAEQTVLEVILEHFDETQNALQEEIDRKRIDHV